MTRCENDACLSIQVVNKDTEIKTGEAVSVRVSVFWDGISCEAGRYLHTLRDLRSFS